MGYRQSTLHNSSLYKHTTHSPTTTSIVTPLNLTMRMPTSTLLTTVLCFTGLLLTLGSNLDPKCASSDQGSTLKVMHIYDQCSPFRPSKPMSWEETVLDMAAKDDARVLYLSSLVARKSNLPIASGRQIIQSATYVVQVKIGTPPQTMFMAMDTSTDLAWVPSTGCLGCSPNVFASAKSTTFKPTSCERAVCSLVPSRNCDAAVCTFNETYGPATFAGKLSADTLTLANDTIPEYYFGCVSKVAGGSVPAQGLLGLGRGQLSLLYQAQKLYKSTFSYCLPNFKSSGFSGSLRLGPSSQPKVLKTTPLLKNPRRSSLYYVDLQGIRVGPRVVPIPPSALTFNPTTGAGTIFDSGTVFTRLVAPAYIAFRDEFRKRVKPKGATVSSLGGFDTCYTVPITAPSISFQFKGMNMTLPADNVLIHSTAGSITCLAMAAAPDNVNSVLNVIANMQQQNHRILFDVPKSRLGVFRERCT